MEKNEQWKRMYNSLSHEISSLGIVRSLDYQSVSRDGRVVQRHGKILNTRHTKEEPYLFLTAHLSFKYGEPSNPKTVYIHKALAEHFIPLPASHNANISKLNYQYVTHINGNCIDNSIDNLKWITHLELINLQPKRKANPKKAWETRKEKYGYTSSPAKDKNKVKKILKERPVIKTDYLTTEARPKRPINENAVLIRKMYESEIGEIPHGWCVYNVDKETVKTENLIAVPRTIYLGCTRNLMDNTYFGIIKAVDDYLKANSNSIFY